MRNNLLPLLLALLLLASCASQKSALDATTGATTSSSSASPSTAFVEKVIGKSVAQQNIVGNAQLRLRLGEKEVSVPGALRMRRDKVVRLQLFVPILGTEVGRLEFTPDYVLIVDRLHKQYVKASYDDVDFLKANGLSFYSLQSLFWNELVAPGEKAATRAMAQQYAADIDATATQVPLVMQRGKMRYQWNANRSDAQITSALVTYTGTTSGASMLSWLYSDFSALGKETFPMTQEFAFQTMVKGKQQKGEVRVAMSELRTTADWEAETDLSSRYTQVAVDDVLSKLSSLGL